MLQSHHWPSCNTTPWSTHSHTQRLIRHRPCISRAVRPRASAQATSTSSAGVTTAAASPSSGNASQAPAWSQPQPEQQQQPLAQPATTSGMPTASSRSHSSTPSTRRSQRDSNAAGSRPRPTQALQDLNMSYSALQASQKSNPGSPFYTPPALVRVVADKTSIGGCADSILMRFEGWMDRVVRVVAVDPSAVLKAVAVLRTATYRLQKTAGHMLVTQPTVITPKSADEPLVPVGAVAFYTQAVPAGAVLTDNELKVHRDTAPEKLGKAVIARICTRGHTVLECYGAAAVERAVQGVVQARKGLLVTGRDVAMLIVTKDIQLDSDEPAAGGKARARATLPSAIAAAAEPSLAAPPAAGTNQDAEGTATSSTTVEESSSSSSSSSTVGSTESASQAAADPAAVGAGIRASAGGSSGGGYRREGVMRAHRFILLQCTPREPNRLLVRSSVSAAGAPKRGGKQPRRR